MSGAEISEAGEFELLVATGTIELVQEAFPVWPAPRRPAVLRHGFHACVSAPVLLLASPLPKASETRVRQLFESHIYLSANAAA